MTLQGLVLYPDGSYKLQDVPEPKIGQNVYAPKDVIIEVEYCGICGSDIHKWLDTDKEGIKGPSKATVTGHEITGVIVDKGPEVENVQIGDRVVCEIVVFYCGQCINCKQGRINICANMKAADQRAHYVTGGGFAKYVAWPADHVHKLPDSISFEEAVLMEPTAGSTHSIIERMELKAGESLAILGPGARGLITLQIAKAAGAGPVIVSGLDRDGDKRLKLAKELGADYVVNIERESLEDVVKEVTGVGVDVVAEITGSPDAVSQSLDIVRPGGRVLISGGGIRGGITAQIDTRQIIVKELDIKGEISHLWTSWKTAIKLVEQGKVNLKPLVSHIYPLARWKEAFDLASTSSEALRVAIRPE
jgi:L-iditol 2-dehydrogenase